MLTKITRHLYTFLFFVFSLCVINNVNAQLNNTYISDIIQIDTNQTDKFGISVNANTYMRNTEYFNLIEVGRTLFGYQLNPSFFIQPHKNVLLQTGVYLRNDYGSKNIYTQAIPTFTLKIKSGTKSFLFGTLEGALSHQLAEPLMDINSAIDRRIENGFQFKNQSSKSFLDVWINWERFIERGSPYKEEFTAGVNYKPTFYTSQNKFTISAPIQFTAHHRGGQIDTDTSHMVMVFNGGVGLEIKKEFTGSVLQYVKLDAMRLQYRNNSGYFPFDNGSGNYANLFIKTKCLGFMFSYWHGHNFIAPRGTTIYQSTSLDNPGYTESNRKLLFIRLLYEKEIYTHFYLVVRYEPFIDFNNKLNDYSYSVFITYRDQFTLGQLKH